MLMPTTIVDVILYHSQLSILLTGFHPLVHMSGSSIYRAGAQNKAGFVYFGMHGALPVYSLKCSSVEGKIMIRWLSYIMPSLLSLSVHLHTTGSTWDHYGLTLPPQCLCQNTNDTDQVLKSCHCDNTISDKSMNWYGSIIYCSAKTDVLRQRLN